MTDKKGGPAFPFSLDPDPHMAWIYENNHPDYNTPEAESLRESRGRALRSAPQWMLDLAHMNDAMRKLERTK